jgi:hypothetical protein
MTTPNLPHQNQPVAPPAAPSPWEKPLADAAINAITAVAGDGQIKPHEHEKLNQITAILRKPPSWSPPWLKARTRAWLNRIINPNFLNLTGTSLLTVEGAQAAASGIWGPVSGCSAIEKFMICY